MIQTWQAPNGFDEGRETTSQRSASPGLLSRRGAWARSCAPEAGCSRTSAASMCETGTLATLLVVHLSKHDARLALVSRHRSVVLGCAQPSERSARRIAQPIPSVLASDATPRFASMASADRQMI